jgi:streptogramin lyase
LGTTNYLEGHAAGSDSVMLAANSAWAATANDSWLHLSAANQSGTGSATVIFTFDANSGATRTGTLTIAGQTVTVTQAGSGYVAINQVTTLVSSGLSGPHGVAVDGLGNVYIADSGHNAIKEWVAASNTVITLASSGLASPWGVAVDGGGNVYIADTLNNAIKKWLASSNTVTTPVSSGLAHPYGVAVDGSGNVYIADTANKAIKEWVAASNTVITLVSSGLYNPFGVAVDGSGNVYIDDTADAIKERVAASDTIIALVSPVLFGSYSLAVDGAGNVYMASSDNTIKEWLAASNTVITLVSSGLFNPIGVAVDGAGNTYIGDYGRNAIQELPRAFVDTTAKTEPASGGSDSLPVVVPVTASLTGPFAPVSDSPWLTITGVTNGVVSFAFTANPLATNRTTNITVLGMTVAVTQSAAPLLTGVAMLNNGAFQFGFSNNQSVSYTVWTTTNLSLPLTNWTLLGPPANNGSGQYQFTDPTATNNVQRFYRVSSP